MSPPGMLHRQLLCWQLQPHPTGRDGASAVPSRWAGQLCHQPRGQQQGLQSKWPGTAQLQEQPLQTNANRLGEAARDKPGGTAQAVGSRAGLLNPPAPGWAGLGGGAGGAGLVPLVGFLALPRPTGRLSAMYW